MFTYIKYNNLQQGQRAKKTKIIKQKLQRIITLRFMVWGLGGIKGAIWMYLVWRWGQACHHPNFPLPAQIHLHLALILFSFPPTSTLSSPAQMFFTLPTPQGPQYNPLLPSTHSQAPPHLVACLLSSSSPCGLPPSACSFCRLPPVSSSS